MTHYRVLAPELRKDILLAVSPSRMATHCHDCVFDSEERESLPRPIPYVSFTDKRIKYRMQFTPFHTITESKPCARPYISQSAVPPRDKRLKGRLISWASLSLQIRRI